jgi:hypothetical protein
MNRTDTFVARCLRGAAVPAEIDAYVENWHTGQMGEGVGLRDLLGLNPAEYGRWMRDASAIFAIVSERRAASHQDGQLPLRAFPEIEQFRHAVADVRHHAEYVGQGPDNQPQYDSTRLKPVLTFRGTTKLHGTNAGAAFNVLTGEVYGQSKERILSVEKDNFGFAAWLLADETAQDRAQLRDAVLAAAGAVVDQQIIACRVFGEWCGPKVNAKTAIGQLAQRWVIFSALVTLADGTEKWFSAADIVAAWSGERRAGSLVQFIAEYPQWTIDIDFNDPEAILDELERLTLEVEAECPVAKALGLSGMGEGIVWTYYDQLHGRLWFKTKGVKHKGTKNSRTVQIEPEVLASLDAFTEAVVTESRLEQGFELIRANHGTVNETHIGDFLKWVGQDVLKEESDTLEASGLERKQVMGRVNQRAKTWLMPRLARV